MLTKTKRNSDNPVYSMSDSDHGALSGLSRMSARGWDYCLVPMPYANKVSLRGFSCLTLVPGPGECLGLVKR